MKKLTKPTLTIAISAYNEESNIGNLLLDLAKQKNFSFTLEKIMVISDGSTDQTAAAVRSIKASKIALVDHKDNKGVAVRQNEILHATMSDILVMINADVRIKDSGFIEKLVKPVLEDQAELTSPNIQEFAPRTFFEAELLTGKKLRRALFESWRDAQNGYLCHGAVRAFAKKFYKKLHFIDGGGEDMYSYLQCKSQNFRFRYVAEAVALIRHPRTFQDHFKQSVRFFKYQNILSRQFSKQIVNSELKIPFTVYIKGAIRAIPIVLRYPIYVAGYLWIVLFMKLRSNFFANNDSLWNATSTKK